MIIEDELRTICDHQIAELARLRQALTAKNNILKTMLTDLPEGDELKLVIEKQFEIDRLEAKNLELGRALAQLSGYASTAQPESTPHWLEGLLDRVKHANEVL